MSDIKDIEVLYVYSLFSVPLGLFLLLWILNNSIFNSAHTNSLHKILTIGLSIKFIHNLTFVVQILSEEDSGSNRLNLAASATLTLYNSFIYASLLLISKGYYITRNFLDRPEVTFLSILMGGVYLTYSAYLMGSTKLVCLIIIMEIILLVLIVRYTKASIKFLENRVEDSLREIEEPQIGVAYLKMKMLKKFLIIFYFYMIEQLVVLLVFEVFEPDFLEEIEYIRLVESVWNQSAEFLSLALIYWIFRSKSYGRVFDMFDFDNSRINPLEVPFYETELRRSLDTFEEPVCLLVVPPYRTERNPVSIFIATPYTIRRYERPLSPLEEPLLSN